MKTLAIVDGHNFLFKSYAVPFKFYSNKGTALHVATTFLSLLRRTINVTEADSLVVIFDSQEKTSNNLLSDSYKANRKQDYSIDLDSPFKHLPLIKSALDYLGISWLEEPDIEADDVIASITQKFLISAGKNMVFIASNDSDFFQLVSSRVKIVQLKSKGSYVVVDEDHILRTFGVKATKYVELKSWVGDKADNIQGISGIGWKRALEIMQGRRVKALNTEEELLLELNRHLIKLNCDLEIDCLFSKVAHLLEKSNKDIFQAIDK